MPTVSLTVVLAFFANLAVAVAKTVAAVLTGSASITAEAAHSWADAGNEVFLLIADRRGAAKRDAEHPLGYGRETYFWSTIAAFGLFTAGAVVSVWHGIQELLVPERSGQFWIAYLVLGISTIFEGVSFTQALREARGAAKERGTPTLEHVLRTSNPTLRAVFAEDSAALAGLAIAFLGVLLHQLTGNAAFDAIGSILVGVLLGVVAVVLIERNRRFLVGQETSQGLTDAVVASLLEHPDIERVTYLHLEFVGPSRLFLVAAVDLTGDDPESRLAVRLRRVERQIESREVIEEAVLTLSIPEEPALTTDRAPLR
ncbi:cation diffusion facilitator family transporter [Galbitalea soli]|uniref:Cation transporter n=1 Tax=Galbitalea soli TaxID=1268042 RepID=A0A7C9PNK3_9MICO|nr:cation transporter [Galbitalea soli]NEM91712.1 cation transporter [Galbitalea soli]NYJ30408.1 cation diffusion facilitator family transporter [Galbitalea soli]